MTLVIIGVERRGAAGAGFEACPASCACLGNTVDCSKRKLTNIPSDLPSWTEVLDVSLNGISHLGTDALQDLASLQELNVNNNQLSSVDEQSLRGAARLQRLKASYNKLVRLPNLNWSPLVDELILSHNNIRELEQELLVNATSVRLLDLAFNTLSTIHNRSFPQLATLHHLYLNDNKIVSIDRGAFDNLTSLEWLKLSKNRLNSLSPAIFARLGKLKFLDLNGNRLWRIEGLRFQGLASLTSLRLRRNALTELMDGAFWGLPQIENLHLDYNNISRIHGGFLFGLETLQQLSLSHNKINVVDADSWTACKRLTDLDLSFNRLTAITEATFAKLDSLQQLRLSHNHISYITEFAFRDLAALKVLYLDHNEISGALDDSSGTFIGLSSLIQLNLDSNRIKSVGRHAFDGLTSVKQLYLSNNDISSIQDNAFGTLKNLEEIYLNSSNLLCDCHLSWLPTWLRTTGGLHASGLTASCGHPTASRGHSMLDVEAVDFKCDDFPKPVIKQHPSSQIALKDGSLNLTCQAVTSSDSPLTIEWKKDHVMLSSSLSRQTERIQDSDEGGLFELTSTLQLWPVKGEHGGVYQCVASNALGTVYSTRASVTVSVFPRLVKTPSDLTVKAGTTARLECAATGQPTPEVAWQKDGGDDFPAARERRMHVMPSDDVFFIVDVKMEDQGVYTCTAKNDAGIVRSNATLTVIQTPSLVKSTREKVTHEGDTVVFECLSSSSSTRGTSAARIRMEWLKDGRPLPMASSRHYLVADSQLLVVMRAQLSDAGVYTCIATNALGSERAVSRLTVLPANDKLIKSASGSTADGLSDDSLADDATIRIGLVVIAGVAGIVVTSLAWVIVIYHLRRRRDLSDGASSTSTDETMVASAGGSASGSSSGGDTLRYCSVTTKDAHSLLGGYRISPVSWRFDRDHHQMITAGSDRLTLPSSYLSDRPCKDSGCFCGNERQHCLSSGDTCDAGQTCCCSRQMQMEDHRNVAGETRRVNDRVAVAIVRNNTAAGVTVWRTCSDSATVNCMANDSCHGYVPLSPPSSARTCRHGMPVSQSSCAVSEPPERLRFSGSLPDLTSRTHFCDTETEQSLVDCATSDHTNKQAPCAS
jgi:Leucine-rich repeat (LRR) protein